MNRNMANIKFSLNVHNKCSLLAFYYTQHNLPSKLFDGLKMLSGTTKLRYTLYATNNAYGSKRSNRLVGNRRVLHFCFLKSYSLASWKRKVSSFSIKFRENCSIVYMSVCNAISNFQNLSTSIWKNYTYVITRRHSVAKFHWKTLSLAVDMI